MDELNDSDDSMTYFDPKYLILKEEDTKLGSICCFACGNEVHNRTAFLENVIYSNWSLSCAKSLIKLFKLDLSLTTYFVNGIYCSFCHYNIRELDYLVRSIKSMQTRLNRFRKEVIGAFKSRYELQQAAIAVELFLEDPLFSESRISAACPADGAAGPGFQIRPVSLHSLLENMANGTSATRKFCWIATPSTSEEKRIGEEDKSSEADPLAAPNSPQDTSDVEGSNDSWVPPERKLKQKLIQKQKRFKKIRKQRQRRHLQNCSFEGCKYTYTEQSQRLYEIHFRRVHAKEEQRFPCSKCGLKFSSSKFLYYHQKFTCKRILEALGPTKIDASNPSSVLEGVKDDGIARLLRNDIARTKIKLKRCEYGCGFSAYRESLYVVHVKQVHLKDPTPYHCTREACGEKFADRDSLVSHSHVKHGIKAKRGEKRERLPHRRLGPPVPKVKKTFRFNCNVDGCDYSHNAKAQVQFHKRMTHEQDPNPYECQFCLERFPKASLMWKHGREKHPPDAKEPKKKRQPKKKCDECCFIFGVTPEAEAEFQSHLNLHRLREAEDRKFSCVLSNCEKCYFTSIDLKKHVRSEHQEGVLHCEFCEVVCAREYILRDHVNNVHLGMRNPLKCNVCMQTCDSEEEFKAHRLGHINHQYICSFCGKVFRWRTGFRVHLLRHSNPETWRYKCTFEGCGRSFVASSALKCHEESHGTTRSYICEKCPKNYKTRKGLTQHVHLVHAKNKGGSD